MSHDIIHWFGIAVFTLDFWYFWHFYRARDIFGMIFWGVMLLVITIAISTSMVVTR